MSVISHLEQRDAPNEMADTLLLWEEIKQGLYDIYISQVVMAEISGNKQPKLGTLLKSLEEIEYTLVPISKEMEVYANALIDGGILTAKSRADCLHIASAVINECHMLLSWNFKHIVRVKTTNGIKIVNAMLGYREIGIFSPSMIVERRLDDE